MLALTGISVVAALTFIVGVYRPERVSVPWALGLAALGYVCLAAMSGALALGWAPVWAPGWFSP